VKEIEARMEKLKLEDRLLEKKLSNTETYARFKPADIAWANTRRAAIASTVAKLEEEWLELSEKLEAA
jgi:ATP-binding cassette subfamily F protein 3